MEEAMKQANPELNVSVIVQNNTPKVEGVKISYRYDFEIVDENLIPREFLKVDEVKIRKVITALKEEAKIPGIKVIRKKISWCIGGKMRRVDFFHDFLLDKMKESGIVCNDCERNNSFFEQSKCVLSCHHLQIVKLAKEFLAEDIQEIVSYCYDNDIKRFFELYEKFVNKVEVEFDDIKIVMISKEKEENCCVDFEIKIFDRSQNKYETKNNKDVPKEIF